MNNNNNLSANLPTTQTDSYYISRIRSATDDATLKWLNNKTAEFVKFMSYYRCALMELETKFKVLNEGYSLTHDRNPISSIQTRLKSPQSIKEKLLRKNLGTSISSMENNLNDIAGVRVICTFLDDVYTVAETLIQQDDVKLISFKDYIVNPKENGYRSLHLIVAIPIFLANEKRTVKAEIQLRTIAMDSWASLEHQIKYKKNVSIDNEMAGELLECARLSSMLDQKMSSLLHKIPTEDKGEKKIKFW